MAQTRLKTGRDSNIILSYSLIFSDIPGLNPAYFPYVTGNNGAEQGKTPLCATSSTILRYSQTLR